MTEWMLASSTQAPRQYRITPILPSIQHLPVAWLERYAPKTIHRLAMLVPLYLFWLLIITFVVRQSRSLPPVPGYDPPVYLSCAARYWKEGNCGLDGYLCQPFANASFAFRCPADCLGTQVLNPYAVGDQEIVYQPLVIGGPTIEQQSGPKSPYDGDVVADAIYRADSFICASAIHAGLLQDVEGGCGVLTLTGERSSFTSSDRSGINSIGFDSYFPKSFGFKAGSKTACKDLRWPGLVVSVFSTVALSLFTTSPTVFFWTNFTGLFFHVALVSDPPTLNADSLPNMYQLVGIAAGRFLPATFAAWVIYRYVVLRSLRGLTAQVEKTVLWLGPAWIGALNNYTFDKLPIQRLTPHDIIAQPGAIPTLVAIVLIISGIAIGQAWAFWVEGRLAKYVLLYSLLALGIFCAIAIPGLELRIHHYILALLLLPGTSLQNRPSLVYQGLLVGLFISGVARWGFASILQTPGELLQDGQQGSILPDVAVLTAGVNNITFSLGHLPIYDPKTAVTYYGISALVNDVERFRGPGDDIGNGNLTWTWNRHTLLEDRDVGDLPLAEYFRFGYVTGTHAGDYSRAGEWRSDGSWVQMEAGPSLRL
ncbi:hypothetical protein B0A55_05260 [Friedmanniomyces simplex]|uniref:LCCL domain-containing protein n=1 Tax=Friedmanniomyces simplex TaxID=329884 RepID=A0A4U0XH55_9PEZI|nr:hypothetical protein B0A55_05260 [Friedmanniomyces simplex]